MEELLLLLLPSPAVEVAAPLSDLQWADKWGKFFLNEGVFLGEGGLT